MNAAGEKTDDDYTTKELLRQCAVDNDWAAGLIGERIKKMERGCPMWLFYTIVAGISAITTVVTNLLIRQL